LDAPLSGELDFVEGNERGLYEKLVLRYVGKETGRDLKGRHSLKHDSDGEIP